MGLLYPIGAGICAGLFSLILLMCYEEGKNDGSAAKHERRIIGYAIAVAIIITMSLLGWRGTGGAYMSE